MSDLSLLADYWSLLYANQSVEAPEPLPPLAVVCGYTADAVCSWEDEGHDMDNLAYLIGMLVYPCDAITVIGCFMSIGFELGEGEEPPVDPDDDPRGRPTAICWAHTIATSETEVRVVARHVLDDGAVGFVVLEDDDHDAFTGLRYAAHDFDRFAISEHEGAARQEALRWLDEYNHRGSYHLQLLEPNTVLDYLRESDEDEPS